MRLLIKSLIMVCLCGVQIWYTFTHDIYVQTILLFFAAIVVGILNVFEFFNALSQLKSNEEPMAYFTDGVPSMDNSEYTWGNVHITRAESMKLDSILDHINKY